MVAKLPDERARTEAETRTSGQLLDATLLVTSRLITRNASPIPTRLGCESTRGVEQLPAALLVQVVE
jgi:hypothetical protein